MSNQSRVSCSIRRRPASGKARDRTPGAIIRRIAEYTTNGKLCRTLCIDRIDLVLTPKKSLAASPLSLVSSSGVIPQFTIPEEEQTVSDGATPLTVRASSMGPDACEHQSSKRPKTSLTRAAGGSSHASTPEASYDAKNRTRRTVVRTRCLLQNSSLSYWGAEDQRQQLSFPNDTRVLDPAIRGTTRRVNLIADPHTR